MVIVVVVWRMPSHFLLLLLQGELLMAVWVLWQGVVLDDLDGTTPLLGCSPNINYLMVDQSSYYPNISLQRSCQNVQYFSSTKEACQYTPPRSILNLRSTVNECTWTVSH